MVRQDLHCLTCGAQRPKFGHFLASISDNDPFSCTGFRNIRTELCLESLDPDILRVFGGGIPEGKTKEQMADIGRSMMVQLLALDGADAFKWVIETHDEWISSSACKLLLDRVSNTAFGVLWDVGHTSRVGGTGGNSPVARRWCD